MAERGSAAAVFDVVVRLLGLAFVYAAGAKLDDPALVTGLFASWGLGAWAIEPAAWCEVALGLTLFHPPTRRIGAAGMIVWMLLFGGLQLGAGEPWAASGSALVLILSAVAWWTSRGFERTSGLAAWLPDPLRRPPARPLPAAAFLIRLVGLSFLIRWAIGGVLFWSVLPILAWGHSRRLGSDSPRLVEAALLYLLVLGLGVSGIWGFVGHYLMSDTVAASIGWGLGSPFQHELAFYHLGVGFAGLACFWIRDRFWLAVGMIPSVFLYGAALVHVQSYLATGNTSPGNWSFAIFFGDLVVPTVLLGLLVMRRQGAGVPSHEVAELRDSVPATSSEG